MSQKTKPFNNQSALGYLPLKKFHIVPIYGLQPEEIKKSVLDVSYDREKISYCTLLNAVSKGLGFSGGFAGYAAAYEEKLKPFMLMHGLQTYQDLVSPRHTNFLSSLKHTRQNISERFFSSNKPLPEKIFTGYDFRYDLHFDDGVMIFACEVDVEKYGLINVSSKKT